MNIQEQGFKLNIIGNKKIGQSLLGLAKKNLYKLIEYRDFSGIDSLRRTIDLGNGTSIVLKTVKGIANYINILSPIIPTSILEEEEDKYIITQNFGLFFVFGSPHDYDIKDNDGKLISNLKLNYTREYRQFEYFYNKKLSYLKNESISSPIEFPPASDIYQEVGQSSGLGVDRTSNSLSKTWQYMTVTAYESTAYSGLGMQSTWTLAAKFKGNQVKFEMLSVNARGTTSFYGGGKESFPYCFDVWESEGFYFVCTIIGSELIIYRYDELNNVLSVYKRADFPLKFGTHYLGCGLKRNISTQALNTLSQNTNVISDTSSNIVVGWAITDRMQDVSGIPFGDYIEYNIETGLVISKALRSGINSIVDAAWNHILNKPILAYYPLLESEEESIPPNPAATFIESNKYVEGIWFSCDYDEGANVIGCYCWICGNPNACVKNSNWVAGFTDIRIGDELYTIDHNKWEPAVVDGESITEFYGFVYHVKFVTGSSLELGEMRIMHNINVSSDGSISGVVESFPIGYKEDGWEHLWAIYTAGYYQVGDRLYKDYEENDYRIRRFIMTPKRYAYIIDKKTKNTFQDYVNVDPIITYEERRIINDVAGCVFADADTPKSYTLSWGYAHDNGISSILLYARVESNTLDPTNPESDSNFKEVGPFVHYRTEDKSKMITLDWNGNVVFDVSGTNVDMNNDPYKRSFWGWYYV